VKGSRAPTIIGTIVVVLVVAAAAIWLYMISGSYDVAASSPPPTGLKRWVLNTVRSHSIQRRSKDLVVPNLDDTARIREGFVHYRDACVDCHGVPGKGREEFAQDMNPRPPRFFRTPEDLARMRARREQMRARSGEAGEGGSSGAEAREEREKRENQHNFWKVKNGIEMTGMPAFGRTHSDEEIWDMVAFVNRLRSGLTAAQYDSLVATTPAGSGEAHEHEHPKDGGESGEPSGG
jgi:mono/diheme cytochrome c family protein